MSAVEVTVVEDEVVHVTVIDAMTSAGGPDVVGLWPANRVAGIQNVPIDAPTVEGTVPVYDAIADEIHWATVEGTGGGGDLALRASDSPYMLGTSTDGNVIRQQVQRFLSDTRSPHLQAGFDPAFTSPAIEGKLPPGSFPVTVPDYGHGLVLAGPKTAATVKITGLGAGVTQLAFPSRTDQSGTAGATDPVANTFHDAAANFTVDDVGKFIVAPAVFGGVDAIRSIIDAHTVEMYSPVFMIPASGQTWRLSRGRLGHVWLPETITRGADNPNNRELGNTFTAHHSTKPHHARVGQKIGVRVGSRGKAQVPFEYYSVWATPDAYTVVWMAAALSDGAGRTASGFDLDDLIPEAGTPIYFCEVALQVFNGGNPRAVTLNGFTLKGTGDQTNSPLDGMPLRWSNRMTVGDDLEIDGFLCYGLQTGTPDYEAFDPTVCTGATSTTGDVFTSSVPIFDPYIHVGATITTQGPNGVHNGADTIKSVISSTQVVMTNHVTNGSALTFTLGWTPQNTDHNWWYTHKAGSSTAWGLMSVDYSPKSWFRASQNDAKPGLGGGRDNRIIGALFSTVGKAAFYCSDSGNFESCKLDACDIRGSSVVIYGSGPNGCDPAEPVLIDRFYVGSNKVEDFGDALIWDESFRRLINFVPRGTFLTVESSLDVEGQSTGTPGGGGTVAAAGQQFGDWTERPFQASNVWLKNNQLGFTVPFSIFGVDGGLEVGTMLILGDLMRWSGLTGRDANGSLHTYGTGTVVAGAAGAALFNCATARFTADDAGLRIDSPLLPGGSDVILYVNSATQVVLTSAVGAGGSGQPWVIHNDGTKTQSSVCWYTMVDGFTEPDSDGNVDCTGPHPLYRRTGVSMDVTAHTGGSSNQALVEDEKANWQPIDVGDTITCAALNGGADTIAEWISPTQVRMTHDAPAGATSQSWSMTPPNLIGPYQGHHGGAGDAGGIHIGTLDAVNADLLIQTVALDTSLHASQRIDCHSVRSSLIGIIQDDTGPSTRKTLPSIRVWDITARRRTDGASYGGASALPYKFTSKAARFTAGDVGRTLTCAGIGLPGDQSIIAAYVSKTEVTLTDPTTSDAVGLTFVISAGTTLTPFRSGMDRATSRYELFGHDSSDPNAIAQGSLLRFYTSPSTNLAVRASTGDQFHQVAGVAMNASPSGNIPTVTVSGTVGTASAKVVYNGACVWVATGKTILSLTDDPNQILASGAISKGSLLADDGAADVGKVKAATGTGTTLDSGQTIVGEGIQGTGGTPLMVPARLCEPYITGGAGGAADRLGLTFTTVKTADYAAAVGEMVRVSSAGGALAVTLPDHPADGSVIGVLLTRGTNALTVNRGGSTDVFDSTTSGVTAKTLNTPNSGFIWQYSSAQAVWYQMSTPGQGGVSTLGDPVAIAHGGTGATDAATARTNLGLGSAATHPATDFDAAGLAAAAAAASVPLTQKQAANGVAALDSAGKIITTQLPPIALTSTFVVGSEAAMLALTAQTGDVCVRTDLSQDFILSGADPSILSNWTELLFPSGGVSSVNGRTGAVTGLAEATDPRFTDARTPTAHHTSHDTGGSDAIAHLAASVIDTGTMDAARLPSLDGITAPAADLAMNGHKITGGAAGVASTDFVVKSQLDALVAAADAMIYKGAIDCSTNPNYPAADAGWAYKASVAGKIGGASGVNVGVGDLMICTADGTASGTQAAVGTFWDIIEANIDGAVVGPASAVDSRFVQFDGATGKLIKDGGLSLDTDATLGANSDSRIPSQKAVKGFAQPLSTVLSDIVALTPTNDDVLQRKAGHWTNRTPAQLAVDLEAAALDGRYVRDSLLTAKGSLIVATAAGTPAELTVGADGTLPQADASAPGGIRWSANAANRIGAFIFAGHSWLVFGGAGGTEQGRRAEGVAGRFASMENISTTEVISLGRSGAAITSDEVLPYIGWGGLDQLLVPPANMRRGISTGTQAGPYACQPGGLFVLYGINDTLADLTTGTRGINRAYPNALRAVICAARSGYNIEDTNAALTYSGFATTVSTAAASGAGYRKSTTNGDTFTVTIPNDFPGGALDVQLIGTADVNTALPSASGGNIDATQTRVAAHPLGYTTIPLSGSTIVVIDSERIIITATNGTGTQSRQVTDGVTSTGGTGKTLTSATAAFTAADVGKLVFGSADIPAGAYIASINSATSVELSANLLGSHSGQTVNIYVSYSVTRAADGTTAATHLAGAAMLGVGTANVAWSGTCSNGAGGTLNSSPPAATTVSAQGLASQASGIIQKSNGTIAVVKRFTGLTAADAGKTIIGTVGGIIAGTEQMVGFDKAMIEAPVPKPVVICNAAQYKYAGVWAVNTDTVTANLNAMMASVVAEFDAAVAVADIASTFTSYGGTLGASMDNSTNPVTVAITPDANGPNAGEMYKVDSEELFCTAVSGGNYTFNRAQNGTSIASHSNGAKVYNRSLFSNDNVHPSTLGYRVMAQLLRATFANMALTTSQLAEANGYYRVEPLTLRNASYLVARGQRSLVQGVQARTTLVAIVIHRPVVVSAIGVEVLVAGSAGSTVRLGIFGDNGGGVPEQAVVDAGTVAATSTGWQEISNFRLFLNPGVYWLAATPQGSPATAPIFRSHLSLTEGLQPPGTGNPAGTAFGTGTLINSGTGTIPSATKPQTVTIAHGLAVTPSPSDFTITFDALGPGFTSVGTTAEVWIPPGSIDATNFVVTGNFANSAGALAFHWKVDATQTPADVAKTGWGCDVFAAGYSTIVGGAVTLTAREAIMVGAKIETAEPI